MPESRGKFIAAAAMAACGAAWLVQWARAWAASGDPLWSGIFPVLALGWLVYSRAPAARSARIPGWAPAGGAVALMAALAVRPWLEPFPGWPLAEWTFSVALFGLVLAMAVAAEGTAPARSWIRPMLFALAALPWPAAFTVGVLGQLREWTAAALAEGFTWAGRPALAEGTALRMGRGTIGLDEACGGIRSLQTAVLLALAIGALRRDGPGRQARLIGFGAALALAANALRLAGLAWICENGGNVAVELWHDRVAVLEFAVVLFGFAVYAVRASPAAAKEREGPAIPVHPAPAKGGALLAIAVIVLLPLSEAAVHQWFRRGGQASDRQPAGAMQLPTDLPSYSAQPWTSAMQSLLRCDAHQMGAWTDADGRRREAYAIEWRDNPNAAEALAAHTPAVCLPLAGNTPIGDRPPVWVEWNGRRCSFSVAAYSGRLGRFELYSTTQVDGGAAVASGRAPIGFADRWREVAAGRRGISAQAVAVAIFDAAGPDEADRQFRAEFARLVRGRAGSPQPPSG